MGSTVTSSAPLALGITRMLKPIHGGSISLSSVAATSTGRSCASLCSACEGVKSTMPSRCTRESMLANGSLGRLIQSDSGLPRTDASVLACTIFKNAALASSTPPSTSVTAAPSVALSTSRASVAPISVDEPNAAVERIRTNNCWLSSTRNGVAVTLVLLTLPIKRARVSVD